MKLTTFLSVWVLCAAYTVGRPPIRSQEMERSSRLLLQIGQPWNPKAFKVAFGTPSESSSLYLAWANSPNNDLFGHALQSLRLQRFTEADKTVQASECNFLLSSGATTVTLQEFLKAFPEQLSFDPICYESRTLRRQGETGVVILRGVTGRKETLYLTCTTSYTEIQRTHANPGGFDPNRLVLQRVLAYSPQNFSNALLRRQRLDKDLLLKRAVVKW